MPKTVSTISSTHKMGIERRWWVALGALLGALGAPLMLFFGEQLQIPAWHESLFQFFMDHILSTSIYLGCLCFLNLVRDGFTISQQTKKIRDLKQNNKSSSTRSEKCIVSV